MHEHMSFKDVPITTISSEWFADPDARHLGQIESDYQKKGTTSPPQRPLRTVKSVFALRQCLNYILAKTRSMLALLYQFWSYILSPENAW